MLWKQLLQLSVYPFNTTKCYLVKQSNLWMEPRGRVLRLEMEGLLVWDLPEALCCVLEQDILSSAVSTQEDRKFTIHDWKIVKCYVKHKHNWKLLHIPLVLMYRLNKTESTVFTCIALAKSRTGNGSTPSVLNTFGVPSLCIFKGCWT